MRKLVFYAGIALASLFLNACGPTHIVVETPAPAPPPPPPPAPEVSYQSFYDALSPYGQWIDNPQYGYVWMPDAGPDFKPYATNGNWVYTDGGWTWTSNYPWGWATFHYGRWFYEDGYGWMWIPGNEWAPAWVSWRQSSDYYGWAPLGPSVSINAAVGGGYNPPPHYWCFVPQQYVTSPHVNNYYVSEQQNVTIINNTTVIHNTTIVNNTVNNTTIVNNNVTNNHVTVNNYAGGPDPAQVSRVTGTPLRPVPLRASSTPGENMAGGGLAIYRPRVNATPQGNGTSATRPMPPHVQPLNNVRPTNTTIYNRTNNTTTNTTINTTNNTTNNNTTINPNNTNNNVNNRPVVSPSGTTPYRPNTQPAGSGSVRPIQPLQSNSSPTTARQPAVVTPANKPQGQRFKRPPVTTTGHPGQPATGNTPPKPTPKKVPPIKRPVPTTVNPQQ
jgi:hypothetical protein